MYHYVFFDGDVKYRWEFDTYIQAFRVMDLLAGTSGSGIVYYQRFEWPLIMNFPINVIILPQGGSQFHLIRNRYLDSDLIREEVPTFKAIEAGYTPCPICFKEDGSPEWVMK